MEKKHVSVSMPVDLIERLRDVVYWNPQETINALVVRAVVHELEKFETVQPRKGSVKRGRRIE